MSVKIKILLFMLLINTINLFANTEEIDNDILSLDLGYALIGVQNSGWGLGVEYERKFMDHLSYKGMFGHMTFKTSEKSVYCTTVNIGMYGNFYILDRDLNRLYFGLGTKCDFLNYFGSGVLPDKSKDTIIYVSSQLGWKQYLYKYIFIDSSIGYNLIVNNATNYPAFSRYGRGGLQYTFKLKFLIN